MSAFDNILRELVAPERAANRARWSSVTGTVDSVSGDRAVVSLLGGTTRPMRYPAGVALEPGDRVVIAVKGTSAMHISTVLS